MNDPLDLLWQEMEALPVQARIGWIRRLANPGGGVPVYAVLGSHSRGRALMIDLPRPALGRLQDLPKTAGLSIRLVPPLEGLSRDLRTLALELEDEQFADIFTVFCRDVLDGIAGCARVTDALAILLRRLERWRKLLTGVNDGLSQEQLVGIFGELFFLRDVLIPLGGIGMIESWTGAQRDPQDFVVPGVCAVEIKTTASRIQSHVQIHGERQLDASGLSSLFLVCFRIEPNVESGESICDIVDQLRIKVEVVPEFALQFNRLLINAGYLDRHRNRYEPRRFHVAQRRIFRISEGFPRLLTEGLSVGIDQVEYRLELRACSSFESDLEAFTSNFSALNLGSLTRDHAK